MGFEPMPRAEVVIEARPEASRGTVASVVPPSVNRTDPAGVPGPVTVAMRMIGWPKTAKLPEDVSTTVEGAWAIVKEIGEDWVAAKSVLPGNAATTV